MHRHTTHWSVAGALHVGTVKDCVDCRAEDLAEALSGHTGRRVATDHDRVSGAGA